MTSFKEFLEEQLLNEEFASEYDEVNAEMDLAFALVKRREKLGMTQQELANLTGIKQPMIARIEGGQMPSPRTLQRLAKALNVGVMFTGEGIMVVPLAGSKSVTQDRPQDLPHYRPQHREREHVYYQFSFKAASHHVWDLPMHKIENKRGKVECDYSLLKRIAETEKTARSPKPKPKETPNAGLEVAA